MAEQKQDGTLIEVRDLAISFFNKSGEVQAVRGINYTLRRGEVLGYRRRVRKRQVRFQPRHLKAHAGYR